MMIWQQLSEHCEAISALIRAKCEIGRIWTFSHMHASIALSDLVSSMCLWQIAEHTQRFCCPTYVSDERERYYNALASQQV